jgi:hypothetical protein
LRIGAVLGTIGAIVVRRLRAGGDVEARRDAPGSSALPLAPRPRRERPIIP